MVCMAAVGLSACVSFGAPPASEGIGFRQARFQEISAMRDYRQCRDEAVKLDRQARQSGVVAQYIASARKLEGCEAELGNAAKGLAVEERMRAYGLGVQNYLKGGDLESARRTLDTFQTAFPERDLFFADGASFIETMDVLLHDGKSAGETKLALKNISSPLRDEIRRIRHWAQN
jgi:hypothetical protein